MKNFGIISALWVVAIVCMWKPGSALQCYVCNSLVNDSCDELTDKRYLKDCSTVNDKPDKNHTLCRKEQFTVSSVKFEMKSSRTVRTCGYEKHPKFECFYNSNHDLKETICECTEDGCNGANFVTAASVFYVLLVSTLLNHIVT